MKFSNLHVEDSYILSPPSRGAWIEMVSGLEEIRAEQGRPPRGGRGLKSLLSLLLDVYMKVAPLAGGVD